MFISFNRVFSLRLKCNSAAIVSADLLIENKEFSGWFPPKTKRMPCAEWATARMSAHCHGGVFKRHVEIGSRAAALSGKEPMPDGIGSPKPRSSFICPKQGIGSADTLAGAQWYLGRIVLGDHFKSGQLQTIFEGNDSFHLAGCCSGMTDGSSSTIAMTTSDSRDCRI